MTELRQKMIRAMDLRNLSKNSKLAYLRAVTGLAKHYRTSPDTITEEMIEDYLLFLKNQKGRAPSGIHSELTGLRFFYKHILDKQIKIGFTITNKPQKLPTVLTQDQVWRIIRAPKNMKHRLMLMTTYSAGLRAREVRRLKPEHIDSKKMLIKVEGGKGNKDKPLCYETPRTVHDKARKKAGVKNGEGLHTLRHSFATHLLEAG